MPQWMPWTQIDKTLQGIDKMSVAARDSLLGSCPQALHNHG